MVAVRPCVEMRAYHPGSYMQLTDGLGGAGLTISVHSILRTDARHCRSSDAVNLGNIDAVYHRADPLKVKGILVCLVDKCVAKHLREVVCGIPGLFLSLYLLLVKIFAVDSVVSLGQSALELHSDLILVSFKLIDSECHRGPSRRVNGR